MGISTLILTYRSSFFDRNSVDGFYYEGRVLKSTNARHAVISFSYGEDVTVPTRYVIPRGGAVATPNLQVSSVDTVNFVDMPFIRMQYVIMGLHLCKLAVKNTDYVQDFLGLNINTKDNRLLYKYILL